MPGSDSDAGEEGGIGWRVKLREFLAENVDNPLPFGHIVDTFMPIIPRFEVERLWHQRFPNETGIIAPNRKYQSALQRELIRYPLRVVGTERTNGKKWTRETCIAAIARPCAFCEAPFVAHHKTITCSPSHGSRLRWKPEAGTEVSPIEGGQEQMTSRYPELRAVEQIADVLMTVPNDTWERVITYARHLAEITEREPPKLRLAADRDTAD